MTVDVEGFPSSVCFLFQRNKNNWTVVIVWVNSIAHHKSYKKGKSIETRLDSLIFFLVHDFVLRLLALAPHRSGHLWKKKLNVFYSWNFPQLKWHLLQRLLVQHSKLYYIARHKVENMPSNDHSGPWPEFSLIFHIRISLRQECFICFQ